MKTERRRERRDTDKATYSRREKQGKTERETYRKEAQVGVRAIEKVTVKDSVKAGKQSFE